MLFNTAKCEVIAFNCQHSQLPTSYTINFNGLPLHLQCVQQTEYLGVTIQSDLKFQTYIIIIPLKLQMQIELHV